MSDDVLTLEQVSAVESLVEAFLTAEAEQTVRDMARHVGDEVHAVLTRQGMMMKTTAGAIGVGVLAAAQVLGDTLEFARRSMEGDASDERIVTLAVRQLFLDVTTTDLALAIPTQSPSAGDAKALHAALTGVMAVRPTNWADNDDPEQRRAWTNAAAACGWVE